MSTLYVATALFVTAQFLDQIFDYTRRRPRAGKRDAVFTGIDYGAGTSYTAITTVDVKKGEIIYIRQIKGRTK